MTAIEPLVAPAFGVPMNEEGESNTVSNQYLEYFERLSREFVPAPIIGQSGNPENVTPGLIGQWYVDDSNDDLYFKKTGNDVTGWIGPYTL